MLVVFPGQGSQKIGMGADIYEKFASARNVFHEVDDAISYKLSDLIFNGTEEELKLTQNAQPAIMAVSIAFARVLEKEFGFNLMAKNRFCRVFGVVCSGSNYIGRNSKNSASKGKSNV